MSPALVLIRKYIAILERSREVSLPDNVLRTARLVVERGVEDNYSFVISRCLASFLASRNLSEPLEGLDPERLNRALHEWFSDPTAERLTEAISRM